MSVEHFVASESAVVRLEHRAARLVDSRRTVAFAAAVALLVRLVGLTRPVRADEAGFTLVARSWHPLPGSVYGAYFVDRPPPLIALFKLSDWVGGPSFIRVVGAVAAAALVVLAARVARLVADESAGRWTAVAVAAIVTNPMIDVVAVKGELLALPLIVAATGLALVAVRDRAPTSAFAAGVLATSALGLKQNLAGAAVFLAVLLVASHLTGDRAGRLRRDELVRLGAAAIAGFALPVAATAAWALAAGVHLHTLWYAVFGFRADATDALATGSATGPLVRALLLVVIAVATGMALVLVWFVARLRADGRVDPPLAVATLALIGFDVVGLVLGGSFWHDYLFALVPGTVLAIPFLLRAGHARPARVSGLVLVTVASTVLSLAAWSVWNLTGHQEFDEADTGTALRQVATPGDTLVVFGGRADVQLASRMTSPYPFLWSLPMRARDPELTELRALVAGPDAPTWLVEWWPFDTWTDAGNDLEREVRERYVEHGTGCGDRTIWLLRGADRAVPRPECSDTVRVGLE